MKNSIFTPIVITFSSHNLMGHTAEPCERCGGSGHLPQFNHVEGGVCFRCRGTSKHQQHGRQR